MSTLFERIAVDGRPLWPVHRNACCRVKRALLEADRQAERDPETAIADMLTDLRHLCDRLKLDFAALDHRAHGYYTSEIQTKTKGAK